MKLLLTKSDYKLKDVFAFGQGKLITGIEVFKEGIYRGIEWTKEDLQLIADNFGKLKKSADFDPPVRIGHRSDNSVDNAKNVIGYVENAYVRVGEDGVTRLYNDWKVVDTNALEEMKMGKYRKRSVEIAPYNDNHGNDYDLALWGVGLVDIPQVEGMAELALFSKDESDTIPEGKEESEKFAKKLRSQVHELLEQDKFSASDVRLIGKAIKALDALLRAAADKEDWWDVSWISGILSSLKSRITMETSDGEVPMSKKKEEKFDAACVREKMKEGMSEDEARKACYALHDKEEDVEDEEEGSVEDTDTDKGDEEKTDESDESNTDSEESEGSDEDEKEEFSKGEEMVTVSKSKLENLTKMAQKAEDEKFDMELSKIAEEAKIPGGRKEEYAKFANSLNTTQKKDFLTLLSGQSPIVNLNSKKGKQGVDAVEDVETHEAKSKAQLAVHSHLVRQGYSSEEATQILNKNKKG